MASVEQEVWNALTSAGLSANQAAGVMGNMQNESSFDPESDAVDSNGLRSYGLINWNAGSYKNASSLVTGNVSKDITNQVNYLLHDTSNIQAGISGSSAAQVAGNFAKDVEICAGCQPGGSQYNARVANANQILSEAKTGNWQAGGSGASTGSATDTSLIGGSLQGVAEGILSWLGNTVLGKLGVSDAKDGFQRLGLILFGVILVVLGLDMLGKSVVSAGSSPSGAVKTESSDTGTAPRRSTLEKTGAGKEIETAALA